MADAGQAIDSAQMAMCRGPEPGGWARNAVGRSQMPFSTRETRPRVSDSHSQVGSLLYFKPQFGGMSVNAMAPGNKLSTRTVEPFLCPAAFASIALPPAM